jgi:hypothetical protein
MPPILAIAVLLRALQLLGLWLAHRVRLIRGKYRTGYLLLTDDVEPGQLVASPPELVMASSPIYLPDSGILPVGRVDGATGVRATFREGGSTWRADTCRIVEVLPGWVALGASGSLAYATLASMEGVPINVLARAHPPAADARSVAGKDLRRQVLVARSMALADLLIAERFRSEASSVPGPEKLAKVSVGQPGWLASRNAIGLAAFAATIIDELPPATVRSLARSWADLIQSASSVHRAPTAKTRARERARGIVRWVAQRPSAAAVLTAGAFLGILMINPLLALAAFATALVAGTIGAFHEARERGRTRVKAWRPNGSDLMDRPRPELERTGQPIPIRTFPMDTNQVVAMAFTTPMAHRRAERNLHIHWTAEVSWPQATELATKAGAGTIVLDVGHPWSVIASVARR